jgi:hypothetical protein
MHSNISFHTYAESYMGNAAGQEVFAARTARITTRR